MRSYPSRLAAWNIVWAILVLGYTLFGRSFAYLGIPSHSLFIGEVTLFVFLLTRPRKILTDWLAWAMGFRGRPMALLALGLALFSFYGFFEALRGLSVLEHEKLMVLRNLAFNIYPFYLFLGILVGKRNPQLLRQLIPFLGWANGIYGVLYVFFLDQLDFRLPWAEEVALFPMPSGSAISMLALLALGSDLKGFWPCFLVNCFVVLCTQVRAEWLTIFLGGLVWFIVRRDVIRAASLVSAPVAILLCMYLFEVSMEGLQLRGGEISPEGILGRLIAPINPDWAATLLGDEAYALAGTITGWRAEWWEGIWEEVHREGSSPTLGLGYGYPLHSASRFISEEIPTPHNIFFYALGYGGWIGVSAFYLFQLTLAFALSRAKSRGGNPLGMMLWAGLLAAAHFGNSLEAPFGAIPFYLLLGYSLAPISNGEERPSSELSR
jgi:hypothetical protein